MTSLTGFTPITRPLKIELEFGSWFLWKEENRSTRRKTFEAQERNKKTQFTYDARSRNQIRDHRGERQALSPLCHPCFTHVHAKSIIYIFKIFSFTNLIIFDNTNKLISTRIKLGVKRESAILHHLLHVQLPEFLALFLLFSSLATIVLLFSVKYDKFE